MVLLIIFYIVVLVNVIKLWVGSYYGEGVTRGLLTENKKGAVTNFIVCTVLWTALVVLTIVFKTWEETWFPLLITTPALIATFIGILRGNYNDKRISKKDSQVTSPLSDKD